MKISYIFCACFIFCVCSCSRSDNNNQRNEITRKTAPGLSISPHPNFSVNGEFNPEKYSAVQNGYVSQGGR